VSSRKWKALRSIIRDLEIMRKYYYVYILSNHKNGTLYVGITSDLKVRIFEHKNKIYKGFTNQYNINKLVFYEIFEDVNDAISREKLLKRWKREWKIQLTEKSNKTWKDLSDDIVY
jgi:putative endonuclease